MGVLVCEQRADSNLDPFDGIDNKQTQPAVESIAIPDLVERSSRRKLVGRVPERVPVATETIIVEARQPGNHQITISAHAAVQKKIGLFFERQCGFRVLHQKKRPKEKATVR